jgi:hypothetical protein
MKTNREAARGTDYDDINFLIQPATLPIWYKHDQTSNQRPNYERHGYQKNKKCEKNIA